MREGGSIHVDLYPLDASKIPWLAVGSDDRNVLPNRRRDGFDLPLPVRTEHGRPHRTATERAHHSGLRIVIDREHGATEGRIDHR